VFSTLDISDIKNYFSYNPVKVFTIDKISANFPVLSPEVKHVLLDSHFTYYHTYSIIGEDLTFEFPYEIYFENLNENFMTSIKNFFLNIDHFYDMLHPRQKEMVDNLAPLGLDSLLSFCEDDTVFGDFFSTFFSFMNTNSFGKIEYKDISELAVFFSMRNNYVYPNISDLDNDFTHSYAFPSIVNVIGHEGINLDKFDTYMLGDMI